ncbi:MAG: class I SAM-dependent methyltransferase [Erythrobacter sp.]|nr:class I SAM-dependent methyltransferase [Erythrobacter sp.]
MKRLPRRSPLRRIPGLAPAGRWLVDRFDPERREVRRLKRQDGVFQPFGNTDQNRYPQLFDMLAAELAHLDCPEVLSFGCSTGEEVRALRQRMPHARITGIDPNRRAIAIARRSDAHPLSQYHVGTRPDPDARYDAVLALAVFRHGDLRRKAPPQDCSDLLAFTKVDAATARLDAVLRPRGLLGFGHCQFRFADLGIARHFVAVGQADETGVLDPVYDRENRLVTKTGGAVALYRKCDDAVPAEPRVR